MALTNYIIKIVVYIGELIVRIEQKMFGIFNESFQIQAASFSIALLIILIGDRIAVLISRKEHIKNFDELMIEEHHKTTSEILKCFKGFPQYNLIVEFDTSDEAMEYATSKISKCKIVYNTKISKDSVPVRKNVGNPYVEEIKKGIKNGLVVHDIVSLGFEPQCKELAEYSEDYSGVYSYRIQKESSNSFLNFILLDFGNDKELIIGWATCSFWGNEQKAFKIQDNRLISYFIEYHISLRV